MLQRTSGALRWLLAVLWLVTTVYPAQAENLGPGGGTRIVVGDQLVGPYRLLVTTSPEPAQTGNKLTVVVRITDPDSGTNLRDAQVRVEFNHAASGQRIEQSATHQDAGNPIDYAAHVALEPAGMWRGAVYIEGPAGPTQVAFDQRVLTPRQGSTLLFVALPFLLALGVLGAMRYRRLHVRAVVSS